MHYEVLIQGFPGGTPRGYLGWSTTTLLHTSEGYALFDTGAAGDRPSLLAGLRARGIERCEIRTIVLSHLHFDHVANVECFPDAEIVLHADELAYFHAHQQDDDAIPVLQVEGILRRPRLTILSGELDVLPGITIIRTPGHTAGHCSLTFTSQGRRVVLAQDAIKHRGEIAMLSALGAFSPEDASASIRRIIALADTIVPGHDATIELAGGRVVGTGSPVQEIRLTLDGRIVRLEA